MACSLWNTNRWCGVWVSQWRSKAGSGWMSCDSSISLFTLSWNYFRWPPVPWGMYKENKITFLTYINRAITQQNIPPESLLNADQTSRSYVSMGKMTMASWLTDKRNIILTSTISLLGHFLPMQFIYQGKATASQPASQVVLNQFAISQNPRQQSNEAEMLMLIDNYSDQKKKEPRLQSMQKALLVRDVSGDQKNWQLGFVQVGITEDVSDPPNNSHFLQPLNLTANGEANTSWRASLWNGIQQKSNSKWNHEWVLMTFKSIKDCPEALECFVTEELVELFSVSFF